MTDAEVLEIDAINSINAGAAGEPDTPIPSFDFWDDVQFSYNGSTFHFAVDIDNDGKAVVNGQIDVSQPLDFGQLAVSENWDVDKLGAVYRRGLTVIRVSASETSFPKLFKNAGRAFSLLKMFDLI